MNIQKHIRSLIEKQLISNGIPEEFPEEFAALTERDLIVTPCKNRVDFTNDKVFTIDSATCKDMDDAVEVHKTANGYQLTVHIADVASYIQPGSSLDTLAFERATSHYLPNLTIPMLPAILSNDLCSLNPLVRRNTLSVVMEIDHLGNVIKSKIVKGIICSRVKGVYSEINSILSGEASAVLLEKYSEVLDELPAMVELYEILHTNTINRGADMENYEQPYISYSESDIKLTPVSRGLAERMIEEYMIIANATVSRYMYDNDLPAIFRIQFDKQEMAEYQPMRIRHTSLQLTAYTHFTSPIRRICDTKIHQILSMHIEGYTNEEIHEVFDETLFDICERATKKSRTAKQVQQAIAKICYNLYFQLHPGKEFTGRMVSWNRNQKPILRIDGLNVHVIGYNTNGTSDIGNRFAFSVYASNNAMYANGIQLLAA